MPQTQSTLSRQQFRIPVKATVNGALYDPSGDVVKMAFMQGGNKPAPGDWQTGSWENDPVLGVHWALCLVGPGAPVSLPVGVYQVWVQVTDSPEVPAELVDTLTIY